MPNLDPRYSGEIPYAPPMAAPYARPVQVVRRPARPLEEYLRPLWIAETPGWKAWAGVGLVMVVLFATLLLFPVIALAWSGAASETSDVHAVLSSPTVLMWLKIASAIAALLLLGALVFLLRTSPRRFGLAAEQGWRQAALVPAAVIGVYAAAILTSLASFGGMDAEAAQRELQQRLRFAEAIPKMDPAILLITMICVGVHEETLFRGLLLPLLRRGGLPWWLAILLSSVLFAFLHLPEQGWTAGLTIFSISIVLSLAFLASRSLLTVIAAHAIFDILQFSLMQLLDKESLRQEVERMTGMIGGG